VQLAVWQHLSARASPGNRLPYQPQPQPLLLLLLLLRAAVWRTRLQPLLLPLGVLLLLMQLLMQQLQRGSQLCGLLHSAVRLA
jgi:hypothetical protein